MEWNALFFLNSILFGIGLAMDAFSVSLANGLNEPTMRRTRCYAIAGIFSGFQIAMPLLGWLCIHTIASIFSAFQRYIPWIALGLLAYIGISMLRDGIQHWDSTEQTPTVGFWGLLVQGIATSIDALSVGFTIAAYRWPMALAEALIIGVVTFFICLGGVYLGQKIGTRLAGRASILGGVILIAIGLEIFLTGVL